MPKRRYLRLDENRRSKLEQVLRRDSRPYMRERASALLQIADGRSAHWVARHGLLHEREPDTVYRWLDAYEERGIEGLVQLPRRKRDFSP